MFAIEAGLLPFGPTPIAMLLSALAIVVIIALIGALASQALGSLVDKRWAANEPLTPTEVLWGEMGGTVAKSFPGLDPEIARDLTPFISERKVAAGEVIVSAGDMPTNYFMVTKGKVALSGSTQATLGPGDCFGGDEILARSPASATATAEGSCQLLVLPAEDYVAGLALAAEDDDADYVLHALEGYLGNAEPEPAAAPQPAAAAPPSWAEATGAVGPGGADAYLLPEGDQIARTLPAGTPIAVDERVMGWALARTEDGWSGWINETDLT